MPFDINTIKVGDRVWGTHSDNFGFDGVIIERRENDFYKFKIQFDHNGQEIWLGDWEIQGKYETP